MSVRKKFKERKAFLKFQYALSNNFLYYMNSNEILYHVSMLLPPTENIHTNPFFSRCLPSDWVDQHGFCTFYKRFFIIYIHHEGLNFFSLGTGWYGQPY